MVCAALLLMAVFAQAGYASDRVWREPGLRIAFGGHSNKVSFNQYEAFTTIDLPWQSELGPHLKVGAFLEGSAGALVGSGETGAILAFGGGLYLLTFDDHLRISVGCNPTYISRYRYGSEHLGGAVQFTSYIGIYWIVTEHFVIGYRFQHMSNARIYSHNPGVNQHVISAGYRF